MEENTTPALVRFDWLTAATGIEPRRKLKGIIHDTGDVKVRGDALGRIWWQGRQWAVTSDGLEARDGCYHIAADRLLEGVEDHCWLEHMMAKDWVDAEDFATAWLVGIALHTSRHGKALRKACGAK